MKEPVIVHDPIYGSTIWTLPEANIRDVEGYLRDLAPKYVSDECDEWRGCTWDLTPQDGAKKDKTFIVALKSWDPKNPEDVGVLVHEMLHVTASLFRKVGMELYACSEEAYCYFHEWLCVEAMKRLNP